jgi:iron complex outermembrane receptor protein
LPRPVTAIRSSRQRDLRLWLLLRAECNTGTAPYFFAPDGTYDIYDYRDPGELRIDAQAEACHRPHQDRRQSRRITAAASSSCAACSSRASTPANPYSDGIVQDGAVYTYVGSENIYQPIAPVSHRESARIRRPAPLVGRQPSIGRIMQDRIHLPGRIQLIRRRPVRFAARPQLLAYAAAQPFLPGPINCAPAIDDKPVWLPQYAITYSPTENLTLYWQLWRTAYRWAARAVLDG